MKRHEFHLIDISIWPIMISINLFSLMTSIVLVVQFYAKGIIILNVSIVIFILILISWWNNVVIEATFLGEHNKSVVRGIYQGTVLFIVSEIFLFIGLFWAYIHTSLNTTPALGAIWPPLAIDKINPLELPLLNTVLLLSAGFAVTWSHHAYISFNRIKLVTGVHAANFGFVLGILLALTFTVFQVIEYKTCGFDLSDSSFGACFYVATCLHGIHVVVGSIFLLIAFIRIRSFHFTRIQHTNFICALWYFHFTDVVWLLLYIVIYVWGFTPNIDANFVL